MPNLLHKDLITRERAMKTFYRCKSNPTAPVLTLDTEWEAKEMRTNLEYDQVDEYGLPVVAESEPEAA